LHRRLAGDHAAFQGHADPGDLALDQLCAQRADPAGLQQIVAVLFLLLADVSGWQFVVRDAHAFSHGDAAPFTIVLVIVGVGLLSHFFSLGIFGGVMMPCD
jgi:hypothetical protein